MNNIEVLQKAGTDNLGRNCTVELIHGLNLVSVNCHYVYRMSDCSLTYTKEGDLKEVLHEGGWFVRF